MTAKLTLCLMLLCLALPAAATEASAAEAPDGGSDCRIAAEDTDATEAMHDADKHAPPLSDKTPAPDARRGGSVEADTSTRTPRWHSFLPGMFR